MIWRRLKSGQSGFTLTELVVGMSLGIIVLLAGFLVIDRAFYTNKLISDREDALQRGRILLEQMTRQLRSQVCNGTQSPITYADNNEVTFFAYLGDPTSGSTNPEIHDLKFTPGTNGAPGKIVQSIWQTTGSNGSYTATGNPAVTQYTGIYAPNNNLNGNFLFQYYPVGNTTPLTVPMSTAATTANIADVSIGFVQVPTGITSIANKQATEFQDDVTWRGVNPEDPSNQPCTGN